MMMDQHKGNIKLRRCSSSGRCSSCMRLTVTLMIAVSSVECRYNRTLALTQPVCDRSKRACDFVQLPNPYYGMWIASRDRLRYFMTTSHWRHARVNQ